MRGTKATLAAVCAALMLTACGTAQDDTLVRAGAVLGARLGLAGGTPVPLRLPAQGETALFVGLERSRAGAFYFPEERDQDVTAWRSDEGIAVYTRDPGVIVGTRGFGAESLSVDASGVEAALAGRISPYIRTHYGVTATNLQRVDRYSCEIAQVGRETITVNGAPFATTRFAETCRGEGREFANEYWLDGRGVLRRSREWISPEVGMVYLEVYN